MHEPQQGAHALAGGEGDILNGLAMVVDGVPVACRTAVTVVVEPLCKVVDIFHILGLDKQLVVFLCVQVLVEGHALLQQGIGRMEATDCIQPTVHVLQLVDEVKLTGEPLYL